MGTDDVRDAGKARDRRVIRLVELVHKLQADEDVERSRRNLFALLKREYPAELLPVMHRVSSWDNSSYARFLYAKAAFEGQQLMLARKIISSVVRESDPSDAALLLGARISARLGDSATADALLARIPTSSKLAKVAAPMRRRFEAARNQESKASETLHASE